MKKRIIALFLACMLAVPVLGGCSRTDREAQEAYRQKGIQNMQEGDYKAAEENFQKALNESLGEIGDVEKDICYYKALAQFKNGDMEDAIDTYNSLIKYDDENAEFYYLRGSVYLAQDDKENGIKDYKKAISLSKTDYELYAGIYENLAYYGYEDKGKQWLEDALKQEPKEAADYCGQGYLQYLLGENEKADKLLDTAVEKGSSDALLYQARVKKVLNDADSADKLLKKYVDKQKENKDALEKAGKVALDLELNDTAVSIFEQAAALDKDGKDTELQLNLIYAYEYSGNFKTAYEKMQAYVKDHEDDKTAQRELTFLETRVKSVDSTGTDANAAGTDASGTDAQSTDASGNTAQSTNSTEAGNQSTNAADAN